MPVPRLRTRANISPVADRRPQRSAVGLMPSQEQWQLTGSAPELYERYAARYMLGPWAPGLVAQAHLKPGERVLDLDCGTGLIARLVAPAVGVTGRVTGLDLNAGMLAVARALPAPPGAPIIWVQGSALAMGFP